MVEMAVKSILIYAAIVALGGIYGYARAKSRASLVMGLAMGTILGAAYFFAQTPPPTAGLGLALLNALVLLVFFAIRFAKTRKAMPAGAMVVFSLGAAIAFALGFYEAQQP